MDGELVYAGTLGIEGLKTLMDKVYNKIKSRPISDEEKEQMLKNFMVQLRQITEEFERLGIHCAVPRDIAGSWNRRG